MKNNTFLVEIIRIQKSSYLQRIKTSKLRVSPIPFFKASMVSSSERPIATPTKMQTMTKARNALNLATVINNSSRITPRITTSKGIIIDSFMNDQANLSTSIPKASTSVANKTPLEENVRSVQIKRKKRKPNSISGIGTIPTPNPNRR